LAEEKRGEEVAAERSEKGRRNGISGGKGGELKDLTEVEEMDC
jgi:hypothetical protein